MAIQLSQKGLQKRPLEIKSLLTPIGGHNIAAHRDNTDITSITYGVLNGSKTTSSSRDWRFKTKNSELKANYIEKWIADGENYSLCFVYLTIHENNRDLEKEVIALHCDPLEPKNSKHFKYKSGPHMHVSQSRIADAHIALNLSNHSTVITSLDDLKMALRDAITMISDEML